eukprot:CAMPEP_0181362170 /NCGR_PEP_ID=MMETSP1106-20121128/7815_1 /TAXON_ID=81844 /ORGANISM="Mantoniella antarctica, Strain SL-175" /LENGTH=62 /DNA_ID=CAMNT_0023476009 /DNA_START=350 /DNA_END=538 /DNA_ORIENTATION=-
MGRQTLSQTAETLSWVKGRSKGNYVIAGTLLVFVGGTYFYTMSQVRSKDDIDRAIDKRNEGK